MCVILSEPPPALSGPYFSSGSSGSQYHSSSYHYAGYVSPVPVRHPDLWFSDGSVVLQAENTMFRVHMSQLSRHSVFFRDLFSLPQPKRGEGSDSPGSSSRDAQDTMELEGCPVVFLHDSADDLVNFLEALYDGPTFKYCDQQDFRTISGILRLSTKYLVDSLRAKALEHLSIAWPPALKGWDAREELARSFEPDTGSHHDHIYPSPVAIINLAREVNAPSLLPSAFYDLSRYSFAQIFEASDDELLHPSRSPSLSFSDLQKLTLGKEASQQAISALIQSMGSNPHRDYYHYQSAAQGRMIAHQRKASVGRLCISAAACRKDFSELVDLATQHYLLDRERGYSDPLYVAEELGQLKSAEFSECKACAKSLEAWAGRERERIWKLIPLWFRLET